VPIPRIILVDIQAFSGFLNERQIRGTPFALRKGFAPVAGGGKIFGTR
jgi:hypothetical protein